MAAAGSANEHQMCDENELLRKKGYFWSREETLLLISLYEQMKELFQNVNYKKKQVWEMIAARMRRESGCSPWPDQCKGKWKALTLAFQKCEDHNSKTGNDRRVSFLQRAFRRLRLPAKRKAVHHNEQLRTWRLNKASRNSWEVRPWK